MGANSSKFNSSTTAIQALDGIDLSNKVAIVTGGNSGIGRETVKALAFANATVIIACRSIERGENAKSEILTELERKEGDYGHSPIIVLPLDLGDLGSVQEFLPKFNELDLPLNYLVCNAGVFPSEYKTTTQGYEQMFGINHLGHFYLINLLMSKLEEGAPSRVVLVSSGARSGTQGDAFINQRYAMGDDVIGPTAEEFSAMEHYGMSKLFNELVARETNRRFFDSGVMGLACRPGMTITPMTETAPFLVRIVIGLVGWMVAKTTEQGAATPVRCLVMPDNEIQPAAFYADCETIEQSELVTTGTHEESCQFKLWEISRRCLAKSGFVNDADGQS